MELKLKEITFPEVIEFNFDELKAEIKERTEKYVGLVYTDDQIKDAKKDVAALRKFTKALSDERIKVKKDILKPYEDFEGKIKDLTAIVDKAIDGIDKQVKEYEDQKKQEKMDEIFLIWNKKEVPEWLLISKVFDEKWLNASVTLKKAEEEIDARLEQIQRDLATLANLSEFSFEATEVYKDTVDINKAIQEGIRLSEIQKRKADQEAKMKEAALEAATSFNNMAEATAEVVKKSEVCFRCWLSTEDAAALREFFKSRNIKYGAI